MKKYKLNVAFGKYEVGEVSVVPDTQGGYVHVFDMTMSPAELALMLHTHFLEEVVEKEWPQKDDDYYFIDLNQDIAYLGIWNGFPSDHTRKRTGNCFRTREAAEAALERVKKALRE